MLLLSSVKMLKIVLKQFFVLPFKMNTVEIDLVSDLHIDQWSQMTNKYPCGPIKNAPMKWETPDRPSILIVAGDISDNLKISLDYLDSISMYYDHVLFVDGNHEHVYEYPNLLEHQDIFYQTKILENNKLIYLPIQDYVVKDTVIIGYCGWWNYSHGHTSGYFTNWIEKLNNPIMEKEFFKNVKLRSLEEYRLLQDKLNHYENRKDINQIIIVSHTVPLMEFCDKISTEFNSWFFNIRSNKLKYWFFGHTHHAFDKTINGIRYICHPRGRPEDHDRVVYKPLQFSIN